MPSLDANQIYAMLSQSVNAKTISTAYALRSFMYTATYPSDYIANPKWAEILVPTDAGREIISQLSTVPIPRADLLLALFGHFWFQDILVDVDRSDLNMIRTIIEREAKEFRIRWPLSHGHCLYDRYNSLFSDEHDSLTAPDVRQLLEGTPQGVYQVGQLISGPLGLLDAESVRFFPPISELGLWHCPMVDCRALHPVDFEPAPMVPVVEAHRLLGQAAVNLWTTPSRWSSVLQSWPNAMADFWRAHSAMPAFLGDCIVGEERSRLLTRALVGPQGSKLRDVLRQRKPKPGGTGDASTLAGSVSAEEQLQLLLLLSDVELKNYIDELVRKREIDVPTTEIREVDPAKISIYGGFSAKLQLSALGIRSSRMSPILSLRHLLWDAYSKSGETTDLDWRLRKQPEISTHHALMDYLRRNKPPAAIEDLVLTSPRITKFIAGALDTNIDILDEQAGAILAWKLGFDQPRADPRLYNLLRLLDVFSETVTRVGVPQNDKDREAIRGAGSNVFVQLEGFVEEMIAYTTWALASDHPKHTLFVYSRSKAIPLVPMILGDELQTGDEIIRWSVRGNTLGACVRYLQRLREWLNGLPTAERKVVLRADGEWHRPSSDAVTTLPFRHVQLWADASPDALASLGKALDNCVEFLNKAEVTLVRNGLEHYREARRFPLTVRLLSSIENIRQFVLQAELARLIPKFYWILNTEMDAFGQSTITLVDDKNNTIQLHTPRTVRGLLAISSVIESKPVLVAPGNLFGVPNADILFLIREDSIYADYWINYPTYKRRIIPAQGGEETVLNKLAKG